MRMCWPRSAAARLALAEAGEHGVDDLFEAQPDFGVLLGRPADLGVDDAVGGEVLGAPRARPGIARRGVCITATVWANVSR